MEIKCPSDSTLEDVLARREKSDAYQLYQWQVQWQIMVAGAKRGWLVFYLGNDKIMDFEVARNDAMISEMQTACQQFWEKNILRDKAPDKIPERDVSYPRAMISSLGEGPPPTTEESKRRLIDSRLFWRNPSSVF